jgi:hypothetical protein
LCFPCWLAFPAQHGYLLRSVRTPSPFSMSNVRAILLILPILLSFVVLVIYGGRTCLHCKRVGVRILLASLWCSTVLAVCPYPARLALCFFCFSCDPIFYRSHYYLDF